LNRARIVPQEQRQTAIDQPAINDCAEALREQVMARQALEDDILLLDQQRAEDAAAQCVG